ncbi:MAG: AMP-binding protein, partial [Lachnospiraceae bacterium]|nr:AMP-binding protein [Lachnospiraceae bacterium]
MIFNLMKYTDNIAFIDNDSYITYGKLHTDSINFAKHIEKRCLIFIVASNSYASILGYISAINNNIVPFLINEQINYEYFVKLTDLYKPLYIWCPENFASDGYDMVFKSYNYKLVKTPFEVNYDLYDNLALLLSTSGSTGSKKLVRISYDNILSNTESIITYLDIDESERAITILPMNYTYALSVINTHIYAGASIVINNANLLSKAFWNTISSYKVTSLYGVPYTYSMLKRCGFAHMELPYLKTLTQAGGKLSLDLQHFFGEYALKTNKRFFIMYGQTEATARISYLPYKDALNKPGSIGIAIPDGTLYLCDSLGNVITTPDTDGELVYKGNNVSLGYATDYKDLSKGDDFKGILNTGDIARFDKDGYYYITGRLKRFAKIYGVRVNLDEIELLLNNTCACVSKEDKIIIYKTDECKLEDIPKYLESQTHIHHNSFIIKTINT